MFKCILVKCIRNRINRINYRVLIRIVIPTAVACAMKDEEPKVLAEEAEKAAYITAGIPGCKAHGTAIGKLAKAIVAEL